MPRQVTFDQIEPNIAELDSQGNRVEVTWKCPLTGKIVDQSSATMTGGDASLKEIQTVVTRSLVGEFVNFIVRIISETFGGTTAKIAHVASAPTQQALAGKANAPRYTEIMRQKATVEAFKKVENRFRWDEDRGQFLAV